MASLSEIEQFQEARAEVPPPKSMDFEDLLDAVGSYGTYQKRLVYFFLVPIAITLPFFCMNLIFMLSAPAHGCRQPQLDSMQNFTAQEKIDLVRPWVDGYTGTGKTQSGCLMYELNYTTVLEEMTEMGMNVSGYVEKYSQTWKMGPCKHGWHYDTSLYTKTVTTEWDLVCDDNYLPSLVYTMSNVGSAVGTPIFGSLSDKIGRKITFFATSIIAVISGVLTVTLPSFIAFVVVRTINGSLLPSIYQLPYLILVEIVSPEMRTRMNGVACIGWTTGMALMSLFGWLTGNWVSFGWICAAASFPYIVYYWVLPESPRWLVSQARYDDASKILEKMAKVNGKDISNLDLVASLKEYNSQEKTKSEENVSPLELFKNPTIRRRFIFVSASWIADAMTYYGFHINISALAGNEFLNFFFMALVELPSYIFAWFIVETRMGRRWSNVLFLYMTAVACILPITAPADATVFITVASMVGKFGVSASYMVMYQQAAEVFPTPLRASGMGIAGTLASIMAICTPYIIFLGEYGRHIPYTFLSCVGFIAGTCALFLPETLNENLPQTVLDGETFGKDKKFFSWANTKKPAPKDIPKKMSMDATKDGGLKPAV